MRRSIFGIGLVLILVFAAFAAQAQLTVPTAKSAGAPAIMDVSGNTANYEVAASGGGPEIIPVQVCPGMVWVRGHYNRWGEWIPPHWRYGRWVPGHYSWRGRWIPGHCA